MSTSLSSPRCPRWKTGCVITTARTSASGTSSTPPGQRQRKSHPRARSRRMDAASSIMMLWWARMISPSPGSRAISAWTTPLAVATARWTRHPPRRGGPDREATAAVTARPIKRRRWLAFPDPHGVVDRRPAERFDREGDRGVAGHELVAGLIPEEVRRVAGGVEEPAAHEPPGGAGGHPQAVLQPSARAGGDGVEGDVRVLESVDHSSMSRWRGR
jgi:hypothetical protein